LGSAREETRPGNTTRALWQTQRHEHPRAKVFGVRHHQLTPTIDPPTHFGRDRRRRARTLSQALDKTEPPADEWGLDRCVGVGIQQGAGLLRNRSTTSTRSASALFGVFFGLRQTRPLDRRRRSTLRAGDRPVCSGEGGAALSSLRRNYYGETIKHLVVADAVSLSVSAPHYAKYADHVDEFPVDGPPARRADRPASRAPANRPTTDRWSEYTAAA